jgi:hypothetical protein
MRRLALVLVSGGALLLSVAPRADAAQPNGAWTKPSVTATYQDAPMVTLSEEQQLGGFAEFDQGIKSVDFSLVTDADGDCAAGDGVPDQSASFGGAKRADFSFDASFPCNRRYEVRAVVHPQPQPLRNDEDLVLDVWVAVALPPEPVSSLKATELSGDERGVSLKWDDANNQPDFSGYAVWRSVGDGDWSYLNDTGPAATSYTDHAVPREGGEVRYKVFGTRPGPDPGSKVIASSSPVAKATVEAYVPPTTVAGEGGAGGNGSGSSRPSIQVSGNEAPRVVTRTYSRTSPTTFDTGFQETLPFQQPQSTDAPPSGGTAIATLNDGGDDSTQRQSLLLVAGGTTTLSWALVLRYLTKRATAF